MANCQLRHQVFTKNPREHRCTNSMMGTEYGTDTNKARGVDCMGVQVWGLASYAPICMSLEAEQEPTVMKT
jgi:hypothetical protein